MNCPICNILLAEHPKFGTQEHTPRDCITNLTRDLAEARKALRGMLTMMDRGPCPIKLDDALTWRQNDELARKAARAALSAGSPERREGESVRIEIDYSTFPCRDMALAHIKQLRGSGIKASLLDEDPPLTWQPRPLVVQIDRDLNTPKV
jgi:hypothetical protein